MVTAHMLRPLRSGATLGLPRKLQWWQCVCWTARCCPHSVSKEPAGPASFGESLVGEVLHMPGSAVTSQAH